MNGIGIFILEGKTDEEKQAELYIIGRALQDELDLMARETLEESTARLDKEFEEAFFKATGYKTNEELLRAHGFIA
jgi:hypothetical protein